MVRGFVKEFFSIATLVIAIWAALHFGPAVGQFSPSWLSSGELQVWLGRVIIFIVVSIVGGLISWGVSKLIHVALLGGIDRLLGAFFGLLRGVTLIALLVIGGEFAGFANDDWWLQSRLLVHFEVVADWIKVMAPVGYEIIMLDGAADGLQIEMSIDSPIET